MRAPRPPRLGALCTTALVVLTLAATAADRPVLRPAALGVVSDPAALVDPMIGTSGLAHAFPGADLPFGMVQWSPDTVRHPVGGGYEYAARYVAGFGLTHVSGPGCWTGGDLPILPTVGPIPADPSTASLALDHRAEDARAGYYRLDAAGIRTELTTTLRSGMGRFTYPAGRRANLLLKLAGSLNGTDRADVRVIGRSEVAGSVTSGRFCRSHTSYTVHFDVVFDHDILRSRMWAGRAGPGGLALTFDTSARRSVQAKVGISYVDTAGAVRNRRRENPGWDLRRTAAAAHTAWDAVLDRVEIAGGTSGERTVFETAMYHALLHPNVFSDVDRRYLGFDGHVRRAARGHDEYANISGWDVYRGQVQLAATIAPHQVSDVVRSMLDAADQTGQLPKWEIQNQEAYIMVGDPADAVIADAYAFGARDFDLAHALRLMRREADRPNNVRPGLTQYLQRGFLPVGAGYGCCHFYAPVSTQLEYDVADHAISSVAATLGHPRLADLYARRSNNWQNVLNPASGYLEPRFTGGLFTPNADPGSQFGFAEGTSYQYTTMVPHDVAGVVAATGGRGAWAARLDRLTRTLTAVSRDGADLRNEPSIAIPWLYDYVGAPWRTQAALRLSQQLLYTTAPTGIPGNDDLGTLSSWYVFSALGLYPLTPGTADLAVGSPVFPWAKVHLASGRTLTVLGDGAAADAPYVRSMRLDGRLWGHAYLPARVVTGGARVRFGLGRTPLRSWGAAPADAPPSDSRGLAPALGYALRTTSVAGPGRTIPLTIGARTTTGATRVVDWATQRSAVAVGASSGSLTVAPGHDGRQRLALRVPATPGRYVLTITFRSGGVAMPSVVVEVAVSSLGAYADNRSTGVDGSAGQGDLDGHGSGFSLGALAATGVHAGTVLTAGDVRYTMPWAQPGDPDNVVARGQTVQLPAPARGRYLGVLGTATGRAGGVSGTAVVHYADGSAQPVTLALSDWTLGGGTHPVGFGNAVAVRTAHRTHDDGTTRSGAGFLFATRVAVHRTSPIVAVTLPTTRRGARLHVFALTVARTLAR